MTLKTKAATFAIIVFWLAAGVASAQSTWGTISGRITDSTGDVLPGVTVTAESASAQGVRTATASENGAYLLPALPPGVYRMVFTLPGFESRERVVTLSATQALTEDATLGPARIQERVDVVAPANLPLGTPQAAIGLRHDLLAALPTVRDLNAAVLLAPSVHATGPSGALTIAGAMSFENLFMVNGVAVNENLRGQPHDLYIEDAIQDVTVASAGIPAEYGRFGGGVVNVVTKGGGNVFSGSLRDTVHNDGWRALTPYPGDSTLNKLLPTYEYTLGGPALRDRLWFFTAGRMQNMDERRTLAITNTPYDYANRLRRYEAKATGSRSQHRVELAYTRSTEAQSNATFNVQTSMDERSLYDPQRTMDLTSIAYSTVATPRLFVEARYSRRNETLERIGATSTDLIDGTLLVDQQRSGRRYWAPTFCGVCDPEERDNQDLFLKATYFLSTPRAGVHTIAFGYDGFNDHRFANNHQSGSDYRILGTTSLIVEGQPAPVFLGDGTTIIQWSPIMADSRGADFRVHSAFVSDNWRVSPRLTTTLGARLDVNQGTNSLGVRVTDDKAFSPRLGVSWDPTGSGRWALTGSASRYVAALVSSIANASSSGGNADTYQFAYRGPSINGGGVVQTPTRDAISQVFAWFFANGGSTLPLVGNPNIPGVTPQIPESLASPHATEYAAGVSRDLNRRGAVRVDAVYRHFGDFYVQRTDLTTGRVTDRLGRSFDLTVIQNAEHLERRYAGVSTQATYRFGRGLNAGATYTLSRAWGNVDGESGNAGPTADATLHYPEYREAAWNYPSGDLSIDQRHRARAWATVLLPQGFALSVLQTLESGVPYGAIANGGVNAQSYVTNPGYLSPLPATQTAYFYTARDAYRTEGQVRTDVAVNYAHRVRRLGAMELFGQLQVINLFNQAQLCGCGGSVTQNGGGVNATRIDQTVRTPVTHPAAYQGFNPFTTVPVEGVNWDLAPTFGTALNRFAYTSPRTLRVSFGVRF